ncbi:MAG: nuclear transport factor 2 family protein [Chloroflexi bacterium]|nr:nuclear transport factor 2 family protein [Chloroflexota bacterium]
MDANETSDYVELMQLPIRYGHALDMLGRARNRDDDALYERGQGILRTAFAQDFIFEDLSADPVNVHGADGWAEFCARALGSFGGTQHFIAPPLVLIDEAPVERDGVRLGGKARLRSYLQATHTLPIEGEEVPPDTTDKTPTLVAGTNTVIYGTYEDECVREAVGWRIRRRSLRYTHIEGRPFDASNR